MSKRGHGSAKSNALQRMEEMSDAEFIRSIAHGYANQHSDEVKYCNERLRAIAEVMEYAANAKKIREEKGVHIQFAAPFVEIAAPTITYSCELGAALFTVAVTGNSIVRRHIFVNRTAFFTDTALYTGRSPQEMLNQLIESQWLPFVQTAVDWADEYAAKPE